MNEVQKLTASAIVNVFETGRARGDYAAIAVLKGDRGHLSYGRSQAALGAGMLFKLLELYCAQPNALFDDPIRRQLQRFRDKDISLDTDADVHGLLKQAALQDPVMRATQDQFFNTEYLAPAIRDAEAFGLKEALTQTIVYDSKIQGGWDRLKGRVGGVTARGEQEWAKAYLEVRRNWLMSLDAPLPNTVYRVNAFATLIEQQKWELGLPIAVRGVTITEAALLPDTPSQGTPTRTLRFTTPYLRGDDVRALQKALTAKGRTISTDGIYGPFTDRLVKTWQSQQQIKEDGAGPATRTSLGL